MGWNFSFLMVVSVMTVIVPMAMVVLNDFVRLCFQAKRKASWIKLNAWLSLLKG